MSTAAGSLAWMGIHTSDDKLFDILLIKSPLVIIAWLVLALFPRWRYTQPISQSIGLIFAILYVLLMIDGMFFHPTDFNALTKGKFKTMMDLFSSLDGVHTLFQHKAACFGGWVHYVVFDLWTGIWMTNDSTKRDIPQLVLIPSLFFTMMLGPSGLFMYFILSALWLTTLRLLGGGKGKVL